MSKKLLQTGKRAEDNGAMMKSKPSKTSKKLKPKTKKGVKPCVKPAETCKNPTPDGAKSAPKMLLNAKQQLFVVEYLVDLNATQAAIRAGYSPRTARLVGPQNMSKYAIKAEIDAAIEERKKRVLITADQVIRELALIGMADMKDFVEIDEGGAVRAYPLTNLAEGKSRIISSVKEKRTIRTTKGTEANPDGDQILDSTYEFKLHDKVKSLELLARHLGILNDKTTIDLKQPLNVTVKEFYRNKPGKKV